MQFLPDNTEEFVLEQIMVNVAESEAGWPSEDDEEPVETFVLSPVLHGGSGSNCRRTLATTSRVTGGTTSTRAADWRHQGKKIARQ